MFRKCIVFIDDDKDLLVFLKNMTDSENIETHCFDTQKDALEQIEELFPGIVFIDYRMVEGDGISLLCRIRKLLPRTIPIMMTGEGNEMIAVKSIKSGAEDYLVKPINPEKLLETIDSAFRKFFSGILDFNGKYVYPLTDTAIARYEFLRSVYSGAVKNIKEACKYFSFSRQDFYNYEKRFRQYGITELLKKKDFEKLSEGFKTYPKQDKISSLDDFINKDDNVQMKLEMLRKAATVEKPNICHVSQEYGFTRESFYQIYQRFQIEGLLALTEKKKGRPSKSS